MPNNFKSGIGWDGWLKKVKVEQNYKIISKVGLGGIRWDEWLKKWKYNKSAFFSKWDWVGWMIEKSESQTELQNNFKSWIGWDRMGWMIEKEKKWKYNRIVIFFKVGFGGIVDWKS